MALNLTLAGTAAYPSEDSSPPTTVALAAVLPYTSRADYVRAYAGAVVDDVVDLGILAGAGAKGVLVKVTAGACVIKFNKETLGWPLAPGGYFLWLNPSTPFPTTAKITTTGPTSVLFLAVG